MSREQDYPPPGHSYKDHPPGYPPGSTPRSTGERLTHTQIIIELARRNFREDSLVFDENKKIYTVEELLADEAVLKPAQGESITRPLATILDYLVQGIWTAQLPRPKP